MHGGKRVVVGQGCRIDSTKIYTPYYHDGVTFFNEDRLIMYSSRLYSSTGVHKTEESVWDLYYVKKRTYVCNALRLLCILILNTVI